MHEGWNIGFCCATSMINSRKKSRSVLLLQLHNADWRINVYLWDGSYGSYDSNDKVIIAGYVHEHNMMKYSPMTFQFITLGNVKFDQWNNLWKNEEEIILLFLKSDHMEILTFLLHMVIHRTIPKSEIRFNFEAWLALLI